MTSPAHSVTERSSRSRQIERLALSGLWVLLVIVLRVCPWARLRVEGYLYSRSLRPCDRYLHGQQVSMNNRRYWNGAS